MTRGKALQDLGNQILDQRAVVNDAHTTGDQPTATDEVEYLAWLQQEGQRKIGADEEYQ